MRRHPPVWLDRAHSRVMALGLIDTPCGSRRRLLTPASASCRRTWLEDPVSYLLYALLDGGTSARKRPAMDRVVHLVS